VWISDDETRDYVTASSFAPS